MYIENIEIDGVRTDDDQFYRIPRIHRVIGYAQANSKSNLASELRELKGLVDEGLITQEEYDERKKKLMNS